MEFHPGKFQLLRITNKIEPIKSRPTYFSMVRVLGLDVYGEGPRVRRVGYGEGPRVRRVYVW